MEDYYDEFERVYHERYQQQYGPWRKVIGEVLRKYLDCGDLHCGLARLACGRIGQATLDRFHQPGFSAYEGEGVCAGDSTARERLASYLVHAPFY